MKIVIVGSNGRLGTELARAYHKNYEVIGYNRSALDVENLAQLRETLHPNDFRILINCAAFINVDLCESQRKRAFIINSEVPRELAEICRAKNARLIHFSTDYVFDGEKREPYLESDPANPISVYGESKRAGEENVLAAQGRHLAEICRAKNARLIHFSTDYVFDGENVIGAEVNEPRIFGATNLRQMPTLGRENILLPGPLRFAVNADRIGRIALEIWFALFAVENVIGAEVNEPRIFGATNLRQLARHLRVDNERSFALAFTKIDINKRGAINQNPEIVRVKSLAELRKTIALLRGPIVTDYFVVFVICAGQLSAKPPVRTNDNDFHFLSIITRDGITLSIDCEVPHLRSG